MSNNEKLIESLQKLEETQFKLASLKWNFFRGIVYGLGFFVGGTLLVALIVYVLAALGIWPLINAALNKVN